MSTLQPTSYRDPLDLLRRFVPTPLQAQVNLEFANVFVETNDLSFLPSFSSTGSPALLSPSQLCLWKLIRDVDVRGTIAEASIVMAGNLIVFTMGRACLIGADRERKEVLAFIGRDVDTTVFQQWILPALCRLTEFVTRQPDIPTVVETAEPTIGGQCHA